MKTRLILLVLFVCTCNVAFAQQIKRSITEEDSMQRKEFKEGVLFNNKHKENNIAFSSIIARDTFSFQGNFSKPDLARELTLRNCSFTSSHFLGPYFQTLTFDQCAFQNAPVFSSPSDTISSYIGDADFHECTFNDGLNLSGITIGDGLTISGKIKGLLDLSDMNMTSPSGKIDLAHLVPIKDTITNGADDTGKIAIDLNGAPIANIIMDYNHFTLELSSLDDNEVTAIYTSLLANFKNRGFNDSYELADIEFQKYNNHHSKSTLGRIFLPCIDRVQDLWWKYGYEKFRILFITPVLLLVFTLLNLGLYRRMNTVIYTVSEEKTTQYRLSFYDCLIYTSVVFFSFSLELGKLHLKSKLLSVWFIFIYLSGLLCMAFAANFILKAGAS